MEAYRDQYATLFNNGRRVVVIGISTDADTAQASWMRDADFPFLFVSDKDNAVADRYGSFNGQRREAARVRRRTRGPSPLTSPRSIRSPKGHPDLSAVVERCTAVRGPDIQRPGASTARGRA